MYLLIYIKVLKILYCTKTFMEVTDQFSFSKWVIISFLTLIIDIQRAIVLQNNH